MLTLPRERKTREAIVLAVLSISAVAALRFPIESSDLFVAEMLVLACFFVFSFYPVGAKITAWRAMPGVCAGLTIAVPILFAFIARITHSPIAYEMTALTTFGAASLALSTGSDRSRSMSLVLSGFLTLFAVAISESPHAVWIAIAWMTVCVWHLVANHWERLELCSVERVRRGSGIRAATVLFAVAICIASGLAVRDRFGESGRLTFGLMPVSGGSEWSDPAARSGVGSGDAAIAARDHAESFGAVESDLFLESTESTLFDMFSDSIGEPKKKGIWERRQGMSSDKVLEAHAKTAKSEKGGGAFSADRMPTKKHPHLDDTVENAVIQWAGPTGIRLAMHRYDTFDGVDWTNEAEHRNEKLRRREIAGAVWFYDPAAASGAKSETEVNSLKVLRLDSARLPVPMLASALHIKEVDRQDFFAIDDDGSYFMPGREKVPQLTVVNVASAKVVEDDLWIGLDCHRHAAKVGQGQTRPALLTRFAAEWTAGLEHPYEKLQAIVSHLRDDFSFDRSADISSDDPIENFLRAGRGGDHLFASTAVLMAREMGLQSRLVTGFYVRPSMVDIAAAHANVLPEDVHVWAEIRLQDGRWFEIEPTPGYQSPIYTPSTWLRVKQFAAAKWPHTVGLLVVAGLFLATRLFWIEIALSILYPVGVIFWPGGRMMLAMRVLQMRARYAGCPRIAGRPQRDWLLAITSTHDQLRDTARQFCDAADRAAFAGDENLFHETTVSKEMMVKLRIRVFRQLAAEADV